MPRTTPLLSENLVASAIVVQRFLWLKCLMLLPLIREEKLINFDQLMNGNDGSNVCVFIVWGMTGEEREEGVSGTNPSSSSPGVTWCVHNRGIAKTKV